MPNKYQTATNLVGILLCQMNFALASMFFQNSTMNFALASMFFQNNTMNFALASIFFQNNTMVD